MKSALLTAPLLAGALGGLFGSDDEDVNADWRLVGVYDATSAMAMNPETQGSYVWVPSPDMAISCGPAKAPDGLGLFEAELIANGMTPTLAILLKNTTNSPTPLNTREVQVSLGNGKPQIALQPAVMPRQISAVIEGAGKTDHKQLVRTQLEMELCLEHKVGRGWVGGDRVGLQQAFLLTEPSGGPDRKYFGGQTSPTPALLGPPDACLGYAQGFVELESEGGQGEGQADLVPSDIWGASMRFCGSNEKGMDSVANPPDVVPFSRSDELEVFRENELTWNELNINIGSAATEEDVPMVVSYNNATVLEGKLFGEIPGDEQAPLGITDALAQVPHNYPSVGSKDDPYSYVLLLIPDWQLLEALRILSDDPDVRNMPWPPPLNVTVSGVETVLQNPEMLFVQVQDQDTPLDWLDLTDVMSGGYWGLTDWGYTTGMLSGREPVVLPTRSTPTWEQAASAQRAMPHSVFLGGIAVLVIGCVSGVRRLSDLWLRIPEERADYWPGQHQEEQDIGMDDPTAHSGTLDSGG